MARPVKHYGKWRIRWLDSENIRRSEVYDRFEDAELAQKRHEIEAKEIQRGLRKKKPESHTFKELCDYWLSNRTIYKRSQKDDKSIISKHLLPSFGHLKLSEIKIQQIDKFVTERTKLNKKTISNLLTLLISLLNLAKELSWITEIPRVKKPRISMFSKDYQFLKTESEISRFLNSARHFGDDIHVLYATAIYTGMRQGELAGLTWDHVDFHKRLITVQKSFDGPTKGDDLRYVPILDPLLPHLREWRLKNLLKICFPNQNGKMQHKSGRIFDDTLKKILERAGFEKVKRGNALRHYIRFHDLRHTFASHWIMNGGNANKLQKILGHKSITMTERYTHLTPDAFSGDYSIFGGSNTLKTHLKISSIL